MSRRVIAASLLFAVTVWAELLVAPILAMPAAHLANQHVPTQIAVQHHAAHLPHPCCPGIQAAPVAVPQIEFTSTSLPCGDEHRCCFRPAPQSSPPSARAEHKPPLNAHLSTTHEQAIAIPPSPAVRLTNLFAASPPSTFGMIIRI